MRIAGTNFYNPSACRAAAADRRARGVGGPQLTLRELAAEVGEPMARVRRLFVLDPLAPQPTYQNRVHGGSERAARYDAAAIRAWWKSRLEVEARAA